MDHVRPAFVVATAFFQQLSLALIIAFTFSAVALSLCASIGLIPWLEIPVSVNGEPIAQAGMLTQIGVTTILLLMCFLVPTSQRVMKLEHAHHAFSIRMEDVAQAYIIAHADDRKGLFNCRSEFDAVKERLTHLRAHPDLSGLEPDILEVAAQMSRISEELAQVYSDEHVDRADCRKPAFTIRRHHGYEFHTQRSTALPCRHQEQSIVTIFAGACDGVMMAQGRIDL